MENKNLKNFFPKFTAALFAAIGLLLLVTPRSWWPGFYDLPYMGIAALVCVGAIMLFWKVPTLQTMLAAILLLNGLGDLGLYELYKIGFEYDKLVHFLSPAIGVAMGSKFLMARYGLSIKKSLAITFTVAAIVSVGWEVFELIADGTFGTHLSGVYGSYVSEDTRHDLFSDVFGMFAGSLMFIFF